MDEKRTARPRGTDSAKVISVIETRAIAGRGTEGDPVREVIQYWSLEGELLAVSDPYEKNTAPAKAEADKDSMEWLREMLNADFEEKDVKIELRYAPIVLCSYASRGTDEQDVIVTVRGSENRGVFEQLKRAVDKINRRRRHHGGEGVSFHISLVDTTSISS